MLPWLRVLRQRLCGCLDQITNPFFLGWEQMLFLCYRCVLSGIRAGIMYDRFGEKWPNDSFSVQPGNVALVQPLERELGKKILHSTHSSDRWALISKEEQLLGVHTCHPCRKDPLDSEIVLAVLTTLKGLMAWPQTPKQI